MLSLPPFIVATAALVSFGLAMPAVAAAQQQPNAQPPARSQAGTSTVDDFIPKPRGTPDGRISGGTRGLHTNSTPPQPVDTTGPARRSLTGEAAK